MYTNFCREYLHILDEISEKSLTILFSLRMDDNSHVFLIKDKIRCIQKKIMDQLAADLNNALNDTHMLTSSIGYLPTASSSSSSMTKNKRRRKRQNNIESSQQKTEASGSTTPENTIDRNKQQTIVSDSDDMAVTSSRFSVFLIEKKEKHLQ